MAVQGFSADDAFQEFVDKAITFSDSQVTTTGHPGKVSDESGILDRSAVIEGDSPLQPLIIEECSTLELVGLLERFGPRLSLGDLFRIHDVAAGRLRSSDADDATRLQQLLRQLLEETALRARSA